MPTVFRDGRYRFHFFSADGHEPPNVHVEAGGSRAKVWLQEVRVAERSGFSDVELGRILQIVSDHRTRLLEAWNGYFA